MAINMNILQTQKISDYKVLFNLLNEVKFSEVEAITLIGKQAYDSLKENGEDINGLTIVAISEQMLGNRQKAISIAHNIWEIGGQFQDYAEVGYINLLINLNLFDMASMLLKTKFETIDVSARKYFYIMLKFSILTGNTTLIDRMLNYANPNDVVMLLRQFTSVYKETNYIDHFKKIQRIITEKCKDYVCAYEYGLYNDRGFTDLEIFVFVGREINDEKALQRKIDVEIENYLLGMRVKRIYNLSCTVRKIEEHPAVIG